MERIGNPFERALAAGPTWETREQNLFQELKRRVGALNAFYRQAAAMPEDTPSEELKDALEDICEMAGQNFPEETHERAQELSMLKASVKHKPLAEQENIEEEDLTPLFRINELEDDADVRFLDELDMARFDLGSKHEEVMQYRDKPKKIFEDLKKRGYNVPKGHVTNIEYGTYDIALTLTEGSPEVLRHSEAGGFYVPRTPFIFLLPGGRRGKTLAHERRHNLIDSSVHLRHKRPLHQFAALLTRSGGTSWEVLMAHYTPQRYLNALHNEIVAELGNYEHFALGKRDFLNGLPDTLATAEGDVKSLMKTAEEAQPRTEVDPERKKHFLALADAVKQKFATVKQELRQGFQIADLLGLVDDYHALALLLKPTQYGHLKRYLRLAADPDHFTSAESYVQLMEKNNGLPLPRVIDALLDIPDQQWSQKLATKIQKDLEAFVWGPFDGFEDVAGGLPESIRTYVGRLGSLTERLGDQKLADAFYGRAIWNMMFQNAERSIKTGFDSIPDIFERLNATERSQAASGMESYLLDEFFRDDIKKFQIRERFGNELERWPHFAVLRTIGMANLIAPAISNLQEHADEEAQQKRPPATKKKRASTRARPSKKPL